MADIYSITGFYQDLPSYSPFGGLFILDDNVFQGNLIDRWGPSDIDGGLDEESIRFQKKYDSRADLINYFFTKGENGLWVGEYRGIETGRGNAICRINLDWKDLEIVSRPDASSIEDLVDSKVQRLTLVPDDLKNRKWE